MTHLGFCDRCGAFAELPHWRASVCDACDLGMNSIAAVLNPPWARPTTSAEIQLAAVWLDIGPTAEAADETHDDGGYFAAVVNQDGGSPCRAPRRNDTGN